MDRNDVHSPLPGYDIPAVKRFILVAVVATTLVGCGDKAPETAEGAPSKGRLARGPANAEDKLYDELRSSAFQIDAATESLAEALSYGKTAAEGAKGGVKQGLLDALDLLDGVGSSISDYAVEPESVEQVKSQRAKFETHKHDAIEAISDALHELEDAQGIALSLEEENPGYPGKDLSSLIGVAIDDLKGALEALGAKVESDEGQSQPGANP